MPRDLLGALKYKNKCSNQAEEAEMGREIKVQHRMRHSRDRNPVLWEHKGQSH